MHQDSVLSALLLFFLVLEALTTFDLIQHVNFPTQICGNTLDHIITRGDLGTTNLRIDATVASDHRAILFQISSPRPGHPKQRLQYRSWTKVDIDAFSGELSSCFIDFSPVSLTSAVDAYNNGITALANKHAPQKTRTVTLHPDSPWYSDALKAEKRERQRLERQAIRTKLQIHWDLHNAQRDRYNLLLDNAQALHYRQSITEAASSRDQWRTFNKLLGRSAPTPLPAHTSDQELSDRFNVFFMEKIKTIRVDLAENPVEYPDHLRSARTPFTGTPMEEFQPVSTEDVAKVIGASPSSTCPLDPLPTWMLKKCLATLLLAITIIVNLSLSSGEFCSTLKRAIVTPLLKKADLDPDILKNFRPVSGLPFISKLIERLVAMQLAAHLKLNGLVEKYQSAYRSLHSTETALLRVQNDLLQAVDESGAAILVMLDLSAAFDTIDHSVLLDALEHQFGLAGRVLAWFASYLSGRVQAVKVGQAVSNFIELVFGVPQGSVLGPVLFTLYTASLGTIIRLHHGMTFHLYADDTQLYIAFRLKNGVGLSKEEAVQRVEACAKDIRAWMVNNFLKLNEDKTE